VTDAIRTPDELLEGLPDFPFQAHHRQVGELRMAHVDEGDGPPVVMWHGEPTWSFLWRKVLPPVRDAGFRVICPDLAGFGRSDKPIDLDWYSYDRHVEVAATLLEDLDIRGATFVVHDWGGPVGLRLAVEHPDRVDRIVMMDTGLFTGEQHMPSATSSSAPRTCRSACSSRAAPTPRCRTASSRPTTRRSRPWPPRREHEPSRS
jgi:haloalkane dehalogenase